MKSIKNKLLILFLILVFVPYSISFIINTQFMTKTLTNDAILKNQKISINISSSISQYISSVFSKIQPLQSNADMINFNTQYQKDSITDIITKNNSILSAHIENAVGTQTANSKGELTNVSSNWWFKEASSTPLSYISKSYYSVSDNKPVISLIFPIINGNNKFLGDLCANLKLDTLSNLVNEYASDEKNTKVYLIDGEGTVIVSPNPNEVTEMYNFLTAKKTIPVKDSSGKIALDENGDAQTTEKSIDISNKLHDIAKLALIQKYGKTEFKDNNHDVICTYAPIIFEQKSPNIKNWAVITLETKSDALATLNEMIYKNLSVAAVVLVISILLSLVISKVITSPIIEIAKLMDTASNGTLTVSCKINRKDELGLLSKSFNSMIYKMKDLINKISEISKTVSESSISLASTTDETQKSLESIVAAISDVAVDATNQANSADEGYSSSDNLLKQLEKLISELKNSPEFSKLPIKLEDLETLRTLKTKMLEIVFDICSSSSNIAAASEEVSASVEEQSAASEEINAMAHELSSMSRQLDEFIKNFKIK